jgi:hypothetical protein
MSSDDLACLDVLHPTIADWVSPDVRDLRIDCWAENRAGRLSFSNILECLGGVGFRAVRGVNSSKFARLVEEIETFSGANLIVPLFCHASDDRCAIN